MKSKKIFISLVATLVLLLVSTTTFASDVYVQLNGELIDFTDANGKRVDAQIVNNRTMVPLRKIFELLGATVEWDNNTRTAFAVKDDTSIKLQIDNPIAEVTENGIAKKIELDSKPILINDRTMVPLRFISESLGKQVAWDSVEQTAIIIDYDYFTNKLKQKAPMLYKAIATESLNSIIQISREYYDLKNSSNNTISSVYATVSSDSENTQSIRVDFNGNSELFNEIRKEGWDSIGIVVKYTAQDIVLVPTGDITQMISKNVYTYDELELDGKYNDTFSDAMQSFFGIDEEKINIGTFAKMNMAFSEFLAFFNCTNSNGASIITNNKITAPTTNNVLIDYAAFDNIIFDNEFVRSFNVINKLFFNYDIKFEEVLYDYPTMDINITTSEVNGQIVTSAKVVLVNIFNEKIIYNIKITK